MYKEEEKNSSLTLNAQDSVDNVHDCNRTSGRLAGERKIKRKIDGRRGGGGEKMKRGIIHTAFREGTKLSEKVWTTSQDPHLFLTATKQKLERRSRRRGRWKRRRRRV